MMFFFTSLNICRMLNYSSLSIFLEMSNKLLRFSFLIRMTHMPSVCMGKNVNFIVKSWKHKCICTFYSYFCYFLRFLNNPFIIFMSVFCFLFPILIANFLKLTFPTKIVLDVFLFFQQQMFKFSTGTILMFYLQFIDICLQSFIT